MNSKGVSGVVTAVLLILLVIGAISILWVVIGNFVAQGAEKIELGINTVGLNIKAASFNLGNGDLEISVERDGTSGEVSGVKVVLEDSTGKSVAFEDPIIFLEFETKTITINRSDIIDAGLNPTFLTRISVYPLITNAKGAVFEGSIEDKVEIVEGEVIIDGSPTNPISELTNGLVAYYPLDNDFNDYSGSGNDLGCLNTCPVPIAGKFGDAYNFSASAIVNLSSNNDLPLGNSPRSYAAWINPERNIANMVGIVGHGGDVSSSSKGGDALLAITSDRPIFTFGFNFVRLPSSEEVVNGDWVFIVFTYDGTIGKIYIDSIEKIPSKDLTGVLVNTPQGTLRIGATKPNGGNAFKGIIDEVRIYDRELSQEEIDYLFIYN